IEVIFASYTARSIASQPISASSQTARTRAGSSVMPCTQPGLYACQSHLIQAGWTQPQHCHKAYTQYSNLCRHKRMQPQCHRQPTCAHCDATFASWRDLERHRRSLVPTALAHKQAGSSRQVPSATDGVGQTEADPVAGLQMRGNPIDKPCKVNLWGVAC
ncbi:unnamed protein product, partial [Protopolystoma xenopodis]